jgi:hypothetical protein
VCVPEVPLDWHCLPNGSRLYSVVDRADRFCTRFRCERHHEVKPDLCIARRQPAAGSQAARAAMPGFTTRFQAVDESLRATASHMRMLSTGCSSNPPWIQGANIPNRPASIHSLMHRSVELPVASAPGACCSINSRMLATRVSKSCRCSQRSHEPSFPGELRSLERDPGPDYPLPRPPACAKCERALRIFGACTQALVIHSV